MPYAARHTCPVSRTRPNVSFWLTHPLNGLSLVLIGWVAWPLIGASTDGLKDLPGIFFTLGMLAVPIVAFLWAWPTRLTLTEEALTVSRLLRRDETMLIRDIRTISAGYMPKAGPRVWITGPPRSAVELPPGSFEADLLLRRLGRRLEQLDKTRVIADEKTRRVLGIPGGGLRDPWTPHRDHLPCPNCDHADYEHPGSPVPAAVKGACAECLFAQKRMPRRDRRNPCRRQYGSW